MSDGLIKKERSIIKIKKSKMKKVLSTLILTALLLSVPLVTLAQDIDPEVALERIFNWLFGIAITLAAVCILLAAFYFITAAGNPEQANKGRQWLLYAVVGVVIALVARGVPMMVERIIMGG